MIEQLRNFIRHGKQAKRVSVHLETTVKTENIMKSSAPERSLSASRVHPESATKVDQSALEQIVAEEREEMNKIPKYPGLERYDILEKMGDGAFSQVYKALDTVTQQKVAIKVVRKHEINRLQEKHLHRNVKKRPRAIERANILKEVQIMRQLKHPSIVQLLEFSESTDYYYLVMEVLEGGELFHQIVRLTYFSEDLSRHVIVQVAEGIRYLHEEKGVVHRYVARFAVCSARDDTLLTSPPPPVRNSDIKPENLLFEPIPIIPSTNPPVLGPGDETKEDEGEFTPGVGGGGIGKVKIADFGLSKVVWEEHTMTPCGTVGYTAPEIVRDERYSKSVDMWALGCVLYTLLCGFPPFYDESIQVLSEKVAKGQYTFLSPWWDDISQSSKDLVSHLLEVDPEKRYTINEFFEHPWVKAGYTATAADTEDSGNIQAVTAAGGDSTINVISREDVPTPLSALAQTPSHVPDFQAALAKNLQTPPVFSPGAATLKEVFDVSYAVHRMEEESAHRRRLKMGDTIHNTKNLRQHALSKNLNATDEMENENNSDDESASGQRSASSGPLPTDAVPMRTGATRFDLNLDGATLLGRRRKTIETVQA